MNTEKAEYPVVERMKAGGGWNELWDGLYEMDPEWTELYMKMAMQPFQSGVIPPKVVQLLCIAVDASATHMYAPGTRRHIQAALDMGVTPEEILEVLKLATIVGIHSCNLGVPILVEEMASRRRATASDK
ncbi:carboxymuconolactone decarboxylase family protein [Nocardia cyriacigeorgica]|uniref:Carboxymuconolactone decarboxylase family protein n=1 Tax=Nocardia cyriacigeorgica TaxID=135487 RepID=A0A6P1D161_9NOCA|nr:carboxymuconolactone decarboxylase family protein [Nocardia cyriacigeorgica]NEW42214.1 carboxymuconolactone decarboxylase family protein [Nocardia cyriacigeorgica]NEW44225.1 carboxymuconolactone decarboxylase family protein [Nocardia cyriacigeorgica]NEW51278.1 carboxymuconolactone decarboxylase family protein [Nocardia cyriacigeorgica]NEW56955.1 carboxymuconolactone decarboxylase family protein [Nocardia cyriacigeorgica]